MIKKDDLQRFKSLTKIVEFLLEECNQIEKGNLKVEIFVSTCRFLREWYRYTSNMILPVKCFECLIMLLQNSEQIGTKAFVDLMDIILKPISHLDSMQPPNGNKEFLRQLSMCNDQKISNFIDMMNFIDKPHKYRVIAELSCTLIDTIFKCSFASDMKPRKPLLMQALNSVLKQSKSFWNDCLKYEDKYTNLSAIKK